MTGSSSAPDDGRGRPVVCGFEELALPHLKSLYRLALRVTGDPSAAEDLVQDTYLKALQAFSNLRDQSRVRPWLYQILSRLMTDRHRGSGREMAVGDCGDLDRFSLYDRISEEDPFPYSDRLHDEFLAQFKDEDVRQALLDLPENYRVPLLLVYIDGMTYRELADVLGCPIGTVMSRLHRGRKALECQLWECAKRRGLVRTWTPRNA